MDNNVRVIYKRLTKRFEQLGYINLNHRLINTKDDLVEIATIFRSPKYETFRMIYTKKNKIVGYESISSKCPSSVPLFEKSNKGNKNQEKCFYKMRNRMERLGADGYYMVHNHPSGNVDPSREDIGTTFNFIKNLKGFKGHLIIGTDTYYMLKQCALHPDKLQGSNTQSINFKQVDKMAELLNKKSIYDVKILRPSDLVSVVKNLNRTNGYSIAMLTDASKKIRMILDIPNKMLNENTKQLNGYFRNLARENGVHSVFFATNDKETFNKSMEHLKFGTFESSICYLEWKKDRILIEEINQEPPPLGLFGEKSKVPTMQFGELIVNNNELSINKGATFEIAENEEDYFEIPVYGDEIDLDTEDTFEPSKGQIKVLYKRAGKKPIVKVIPDTLEAKQKLVGGLIEVVPYDGNTLLICNEEGKLLNLKPNVCFTYDWIAGDCFVIGDDYKNAGFKSLTSDEIKKAKEDLMSKSFNNIDMEDSIDEEKDYSRQDKRDL